MRSTRPKDPKEGLIPILPGSRTVGSGKSTTSEDYWRSYYKTHGESPDSLRETVALLNASGKSRDVRAALLGYLTHHAKNAQPWMYTALALATRMNQGKEEDVKTALGYAADLAERSGNPNDLVSVADQMVLMNQLDRVGSLLDRAMDTIPHRGEPILMSLNLAEKKLDPKRMGDGAERILSLGWPGDPGFDDGLRRDLRRRVEALAKNLRESGRSDEANALVDGLTTAEARDIFIRLTWEGDADLDLVVEEPLGAIAQVSTPRTVFGGAILKNGYGKHPEEVYACPRGFDGVYSVRVATIWNNPDKPATQAKLEIITHEGTAEEHKEVHDIRLESPRKPVTVTLKDGRRKKALPYFAPSVVLPRALVESAKKPGGKPGAGGAAPAKAARGGGDGDAGSNRPAPVPR